MGKKKKTQPPPPIEVDKAFYELQISDIKRRISNLSVVSTELREKNDVLECKIDKLDEERGDLIRNLKKTYLDKVNDVANVVENIQNLHELTAYDKKMNAIKLENLKEKYNLERGQFTGQIKEMNGKLTAVETFKAEREYLYEKYKANKLQFENAELELKKTLYNIDKKFNVSKQAFKKEMEKLIFEMASRKEKQNDIKIAATTHHIVRENYTIHNELDIVNNSNNRLLVENAQLNDDRENLQANINSCKKESKMALSNISIQNELRNTMKEKHKNLLEKIAADNIFLNQKKSTETKLNNTLKLESNLKLKLRTMEQNLHAVKCQKQSMENHLQQVQKTLSFYRNIINTVVLTIKANMRMKVRPHLGKYLPSNDRENLLSKLLDTLTSKQTALETRSSDTILSSAAVFAKGDLGISLSTHKQERKPHLGVQMESQVGMSFQSFLNKQPRRSLKSVESFLLEESFSAVPVHRVPERISVVSSDVLTSTTSVTQEVTTSEAPDATTSKTSVTDMSQTTEDTSILRGSRVSTVATDEIRILEDDIEILEQYYDYINEQMSLYGEEGG